MAISNRYISKPGISQRGISDRGVSVVDRICYAYNFDGVDDRGVLASRAVNVDSNNTFEFFSPSFTGVNQTIIAQNLSSNIASQEFQIYVTSTNQMGLSYGGAALILFTQAQGFKASTRYGLTLIGTTAQIFEGGLSGTLVRTVSFTRGAAREPTAATLIGCRGNGVGAYLNFFSGLQYDIKINGALWDMGNKDSATQPSLPAGNNMTLVNTTSDRWEQVPCRITP